MLSNLISNYSYISWYLIPIPGTWSGYLTHFLIMHYIRLFIRGRLTTLPPGHKVKLRHVSLVVRFHFESQSGLHWFCFTSLRDLSRKLSLQLGQSEKNCPNPWPYKNIQISTSDIVFLVFWLVQPVPVISPYNGLRYLWKHPQRFRRT